jgi:hypothetical protein
MGLFIGALLTARHRISTAAILDSADGRRAQTVRGSVAPYPFLCEDYLRQLKVIHGT